MSKFFLCLFGCGRSPALVFDVKKVDEFGREVKQILGGKLRSPFETLDVKTFNRAIENFVEIIDQEEAHSTGD